ncbi:MAG: hypothetical protein Q9178_003092 [Gyalolechia marmorata]
MPAPTLSQMARRCLVKNISMLTDIGDVPYDMIRPVLLKIENPNQLKSLEEASPQLYGADEEIWLSLIKRDIPKAEEKMIYPNDPKNWWKVYRKMLKDHQKEVEEDAIKLKNAYNGIREGKKPPPPIMAGVPHIPKLGGMKYAHAMDYNKCYVKRRVRKVAPVTNVQRFGATSKKELTGKGVMAKVRREAMEQSQRQKVMSTPTHRLNGLTSQILVPPRHMVEQHRKPPAPQPLDSHIPKPASIGPPSNKFGNNDRQRERDVGVIEERERRLRALTNPASTMKSGTSATLATSKEAPTASSANSTTASGPSMKPKPAPNTNTRPPPVSPVSLTPGVKRKAENPPSGRPIDAEDFAQSGNQSHDISSAPRYRLPQVRSMSPDTRTIQRQKRKAPTKGFTNVFLPVKKNRVA